MGMYSSNAKGLWLLDSNTVTDAEKLRGQVDFIVIHAGIGDKPSLKFLEHYDKVKGLDVPIFGYVEADAEISIGWTFNPSVWPDELHDPTAQMCYRQTKYPNGTQAKISGWFIDGSKHTQTDKKEIGDNWVQGIFAYEVGNIFKRSRAPVYPLIKKATVNIMPKDGALITWLSNQASISTYEPALHPVPTGFGSAYIPGDIDGIQQPYSGSWDFWWYGSAPVPGIQGAVVLFLYNGTKTKLYNEVGYKPATVPVTPPPLTDPGTTPSPSGDDAGTGTPTSGDGTQIDPALGAKIDALTLAVSALAQAVITLTNIVKPFFARF